MYLCRTIGKLSAIKFFTDIFSLLSFRSMAASADSWVKEYNEAVKLAEDINGMISERTSLPATGPDAQRHASSIRRKITILGTRLDSLQSLLSKIPGKQPM